MLSRVKLILIMFLLLATFGQAVASSMMVCSQDMQSLSQNMAMDHGTHQMADGMGKQLNADDEACCAKECRCTIGSCFSLALTAEASVEPIDSSLIKLNYASLMVPSQTSASLYRPPIS